MASSHPECDLKMWVQSPLPVSNIGLFTMPPVDIKNLMGWKIELRYNGNHIDVTRVGRQYWSYGSKGHAVCGEGIKCLLCHRTSFVPITFRSTLVIQRANDHVDLPSISTGPSAAPVNLFMVYD
ncbi:hypothetical protein DMH17_01985 [Raoultella planticola]|nr:hypothetical protein [Raoultella planticola]